MMNWDFYFKHLRTEDAYYKLLGSGFFWEFFPLGYKSWDEHEKAMEEYDKTT